MSHGAHPKAETCSRCGQEVRYGTRHGVTGWLHREDVDHIAILGQIFTPEMAAEVERQRNVVVRHFDDGTSYTTAEYDIEKDRVVDRRRARLAELRGEALQTEHEIPPVEIPCHPLEVEDLPPRSGMRQVANLLLKTDGWELRRLTHARGPYIGQSGECLSISDTIVIGGRCKVDDGTRIAVASWRDGKFDHAFIGTIRGGTLDPRLVDATTMKDWIKGIA